MGALMNLDLHDCTIEEINYHWQSASVKIGIWRYCPDRQKSVLNYLELSGVTELFIPHVSSWGPSNSINKVILESGNCKIEVQSGDTITAKFTEVNFIESNS
jgi:hypothetical protein